MYCCIQNGSVPVPPSPWVSVSAISAHVSFRCISHNGGFSRTFGIGISRSILLPQTAMNKCSLKLRGNILRARAWQIKTAGGRALTANYAENMVGERKNIKTIHSDDGLGSTQLPNPFIEYANCSVVYADRFKTRKWRLNIEWSAV